MSWVLTKKSNLLLKTVSQITAWKLLKVVLDQISFYPQLNLKTAAREINPEFLNIKALYRNHKKESVFIVVDVSMLFIIKQELWFFLIPFSVLEMNYPSAQQNLCFIFICSSYYLVFYDKCARHSIRYWCSGMLLTSHSAK